MTTSTKSSSSRKLVLTLPFYQDAIVRYYAHKYHRLIVDVVRSIIPLFAKADDRFDAGEYQQFVRDVYVPYVKNRGMSEVTPEFLEILDMQVKDFLAATYDANLSVFLPPSTSKKIQTRARNRNKATPKNKRPKTARRS